MDKNFRAKKWIKDFKLGEDYTPVTLDDRKEYIPSPEVQEYLDIALKAIRIVEKATSDIDTIEINDITFLSCKYHEHHLQENKDYYEEIIRKLKKGE